MFFELIIAILCGVLIGIFTGLIPGIHVNLVAVSLVSVSPFLIQHFDVLYLVVFLIALSVTHTFLDSIPAIFLGAPDAETALGVLPGHRYLLKGQGMDAVRLTIIGSFGALLISILFFPFFVLILRVVYPLVEKFIAYFLILIVIFMLLKENRRGWAVLVFLMSGVLGVIVFNSNIKNFLFPLLSGLFGISTLLISLKSKNKIPEQKADKKIYLNKSKILKALAAGQFSGFITAVLPGIGASTAAVIGMQLIKKIKDYQFMVLLGSVNTVNFILSISALYVLDKARNGAIVAVSELMQDFNADYLTIFLLAALIAGCISVFLALKTGGLCCTLINRIDYNKMAVLVILFISFLSIILSGFNGFLVLVVSAGIGLIPIIKKVKRTHAMACIIMPVILYLI